MTAFLLLCACISISSAAVMFGQINGELCVFIVFDIDSAIGLGYFLGRKSYYCALLWIFIHL